MQKKVPMFYRGMPSGSITLSGDGPHYTFVAECPATVSGLMRAFAGISTRPEARLLIGVMEPTDAGVLRAVRVCTKNTLKEAKVAPDEIDGGEMVLYQSFDAPRPSQTRWQRYERPALLFQDRALRAALKNAREVLVDDLNRPRCAAVPLTQRTPFDFAPAFTIVRVEYIDGKAYGVLGISNRGAPYMLGK